MSQELKSQLLELERKLLKLCNGMPLALELVGCGLHAAVPELTKWKVGGSMLWA